MMSNAACDSVFAMRRLVAALSLILVLVGAAWCVDGCEDASQFAGTTPPGSVCTFCVVPFAVTPQFALQPDTLPIKVDVVPVLAKVISVPPLRIDHPPRAS